MIRIRSDYNNDEPTYRIIFGHEYLHHILFLMNISDENQTDVHINEALTETFIWYSNKETQEQFRGVNDSQGLFPYNMIIDQIFSQNKFSCLDKVFKKDDKIKDVQDYKKRLINYCNVTI